MHSPTGEQYQLTCAAASATVCEVGATLRRLVIDGADVITSFPPDGTPFGCQGQHLVPWPNRIRDGRYVWHDGEQQLPLSEPARGNAIHGLAQFVPWRLVDRDESWVRQEVVLFPQPGWPGTVRVEVTHTVSASGLGVDVVAENVGRGTMPFGYGAHPYLQVDLDRTRLTLPAARVLTVDERLLPVALADVGTHVTCPLDGRAPVGDANLDTAFTGLGAAGSAAGGWRIELAGDDTTVAVWADAALGWVQCYTPADRRSIAIEPMSCGPDAFNAGAERGLVTLAPGGRWSASWGIDRS